MPAIEPPFDEHYTITDLGQIDGVPADYGGLTFSHVSGALLIGGSAASLEGQIYSVPVVRDAQGHITEFDPPLAYAEAPYIDGGLAIGPGGVIFYSRYDPPGVEIGQLLPSTPASDGILTESIIDLAPLGVVQSPGGLNLVPAGFPGAGSLKLTSYSDGDWYDLELTPAGDGTYDVTSATLQTDLPDGMENFVFLPPGLPGFDSTPGMLINEYDGSSIAAYELDDNGDPMPNTRQLFLSGIPGPDGAAFDPASGDLIISDYNDDRLYRISGFPAPPPYIKGDNDCDGDIDSQDALTGLLYVAALDVNQEYNCRTFGSFTSTAPASVPAAVFGDIDCDEDVDALDNLAILRFVAAHPAELPQGCPPLELP